MKCIQIDFTVKSEVSFLFFNNIKGGSALVLQYKCPDCGADMSYDADTKLLTCPSCGKTKEISLMDEMNASSGDKVERIHNPDVASKNVDEVYGDFEQFEEQSTYSNFNEDEAHRYICQNCGAELITDKDTTATTCSYCSAPMILGDRLSGVLAPSKVIPFTISKENAEKAFVKWCKGGLITPNEFMNGNRIKSITGMYVPFWLYDVNGRGEASGTAKKVRTYTSGDYNITETHHYNIYRKVSLNFDYIPVDASEKMPDDMMDKLEPFSYKELFDFKTPYLSGYIAEKYNYTDKDLFPRMEKKTFQYIDDYINGTVSNYTSYSLPIKNYQAKQRNSYYTLLPVWMLCYNFHGKDYMFAMNGQTGKVVGKPPISKSKMLLWFVLFTLNFFLLFCLCYYGIGGHL